jgi:hypothetical protein
MNTDRGPRIEVAHDPDRIFRVGMLGGHEPARIVGADRKQSQIDGA